VLPLVLWFAILAFANGSCGAWRQNGRLDDMFRQMEIWQGQATVWRGKARHRVADDVFVATNCPVPGSWSPSLPGCGKGAGRHGWGAPPGFDSRAAVSIRPPPQTDGALDLLETVFCVVMGIAVISIAAAPREVLRWR